MELEASMSRIMTQRYCMKVLTFLNVIVIPLVLFEDV